MSSEVKANKLSPATGTDVVLGDASDTFTIPASATLAVASGATITNSGTATGFGGTNTPAFTAYSNTDQTVTTATWTKASLQAEIIDTDSAFDSTTNYRFTVPSGEGGNYAFWGSICGYDSTGTDETSVKIYENGSEITGSVAHSNAPGDYQLASTSIVVALSAGDYIELYGYASGGGTVKFQNFGTILSGYKLVS